MNCIFKDNERRTPNGCMILETATCAGENCEWKKTELEYLESLHKARMNYIKHIGTDKYIDHVPTRWRQKYRDYERIKDNENGKN